MHVEESNIEDNDSDEDLVVPLDQSLLDLHDQIMEDRHQVIEMQVVVDITIIQLYFYYSVAP